MTGASMLRVSALPLTVDTDPGVLEPTFERISPRSPARLWRTAGRATRRAHARHAAIGHDSAACRTWLTGPASKVAAH
jgi:hypothetical protein